MITDNKTALPIILMADILNLILKRLIKLLEICQLNPLKIQIL